MSQYDWPYCVFHETSKLLVIGQLPEHRALVACWCPSCSCCDEWPLKLKEGGSA